MSAEEKKNGLLVYVKSAEHAQEMQKKYPSVKAEYLPMKGGDTMGDTLPMVCMTKAGRERCEVGEEFIATFSKELESPDEE